MVEVGKHVGAAEFGQTGPALAAGRLWRQGAD
jgi:hypothetical protein